MTQRVAAAVVGIPILVSAIWWGSPWLTLLLVLVVPVAVRELYRLAPSSGTALPVPLGMLWGISFIVGGQAASGLDNFLIISAGVFLAGTFVSLLWIVAFYHGQNLPTTAAYLIGGPVYVGFLLSHALALRELGDGAELGRNFLLLAVLVTFATDSGAFFVGRALGRHQMAPSISPNKTWEGAVGGFVLAVVVALVLGIGLDLPLPRWQLAIIGATVGVVSQVGDILESKLKRISNVKDAGSLIPGHGGILDRLDSLLLSIPTVYYLLVVLFER